MVDKWHGGKGSKRRPENPDNWDKGWERIFKKAKEDKQREISELNNVTEEKSKKKKWQK